MADMVAEVVRCANFAAFKHRDQRRKNPEKTPYINHPIGVAHILTNEGGITDSNVIMAALLHDTVEDTDTTPDEIKAEFGEKIAGIVGEVTDDKNLPKLERKRLQIEHAPSASHEAKLVKLADKLHNLRELERVSPEGWSHQRVEEYFHWSARVVRGLRGTNTNIETQLHEIFERRNCLHLAK